jgi:hypothetical protein
MRRQAEPLDEDGILLGDGEGEGKGEVVGMAEKALPSLVWRT